MNRQGMSMEQTVLDRYQTICEEAKEKFPDFIAFLRYEGQVKSFLRYWQQTPEPVRTKTLACGFGAALMLAALDSRQAVVAAVTVSTELHTESALCVLAES